MKGCYAALVRLCRVELKRWRRFAVMIFVRLVRQQIAPKDGAIFFTHAYA